MKTKAMKLYVFVYIHKGVTKTSYISAHTLSSAKEVFKHTIRKQSITYFTMLRISEFTLTGQKSWND